MSDGKEWMPEYIRKLEDENISFEEVVEFVQQYMPKKLYAYRRINEYWRKTVFEGCVHMGYASDFNDPFDCLPTVDFSKDSTDIAKAYREFCKSKNPQYKKAKQEIDSSVNDLIENIQKNALIACFTETYKSMLMWSYYAENHKGICIEYDTKKDDVFKSITLPVIYEEKRYNALRQLATQNRNIIINSHLYKAACWKHENEWRILCSADNGVYPENNIFMKRAISGVYLGAKINADIEKEICEWGKKENIPIYKMELDNTTYELKRRKL